MPPLGLTVICILPVKWNVKEVKMESSLQAGANRGNGATQSSPRRRPRKKDPGDGERTGYPDRRDGSPPCSPVQTSSQSMELSCPPI